MKLAPGDLLILKWMKLAGEPMSSYLIVCVQGASVWYIHSQMQKILETTWDVIDDAVKSGELVVVDVCSGKGSDSGTVHAREGVRQVP